MTTRLVRKWKVKSAAWAGVLAGAITGPLAYALLVSTDPAAPPRVLTVVATGPERGAADGLDVTLTPADPSADVDDLLRLARSGSADERARTRAVARLGRTEGPAAVRALVALAQERDPDEALNVVGLAALNALWARGEHALVRELADASPDPAMKSKALALARRQAK